MQTWQPQKKKKDSNRHISQTHRMQVHVLDVVNDRRPTANIIPPMDCSRLNRVLSYFNWQCNEKTGLFIIIMIISYSLVSKCPRGVAVSYGLPFR